MAEVELRVTLKKGGGATGATMRVDRKSVKMAGALVGSVVIKTTAPETGIEISDHSYTIRVFGNHLASLDYKVEQGTFTLLEGKLGVSYGNTENATRGKFKHRA